MEPQFPGVVEHYVNLDVCYDTAALGDIRGKIISCMAGYKGCYGRAYRCIAAAAQIGEDMRLTATTSGVEARMARRASGILSREVKKLGKEPGRATQRFLSGLTGQGLLCNFATVDVLCKRVYELCDTYGLGGILLTHLAGGAMAAGYDVIVCPSPLFPERLEHLLIPALSLAFVTGTATHPYPGQTYRRLRMDAMADPEALRHNRARLRFSRKVSAALMEEAAAALAEAKAKHDALEALYNPHVDFAQVYATAERIAAELLCRI